MKQLSKPCNSTSIMHLIPMTYLLMKKSSRQSYKLRESAAVIYIEGQVNCQGSMLGLSDLFSVINGYSLRNMIVIAPHSTRAACYIVLLTSNTKRRAFFLVRRHSETHVLESSLIPVTSYSSMAIRVSACIFPTFTQLKKRLYRDQIFSGMSKILYKPCKLFKCRKNTQSKFHFICTLNYSDFD